MNATSTPTRAALPAGTTFRKSRQASERLPTASPPPAAAVLGQRIERVLARSRPDEADQLEYQHLGLARPSAVFLVLRTSAIAVGRSQLCPISRFATSGMVGCSAPTAAEADVGQ